MSILIAFSKIYEKEVSIQITDYLSYIFSSLFWALRKKNIAVNQRFWTWLKISNVHLTVVNILHVSVRMLAKPLIVYLIVLLIVNCMLMDFPEMRVR